MKRSSARRLQGRGSKRRRALSRHAKGSVGRHRAAYWWRARVECLRVVEVKGWVPPVRSHASALAVGGGLRRHGSPVNVRGPSNRCTRAGRAASKCAASTAAFGRRGELANGAKRGAIRRHAPQHGASFICGRGRAAASPRSEWRSQQRAKQRERCWQREGHGKG